MVGGDEKGRERQDGGNASAQGCRKCLRVRREVQVSCTKFQNPQHGGEVCRSWQMKKKVRCCWIVVQRKGKNGQKHWQCDEEVQNVEEKPWKNEELRSAQEALPRPKECLLEEVSRLCKAKTGVGCDGFHPEVPLDLTKETRGEIVEFPEKVEESGKWRQHACTTMFFLIPKNVTSERPIALMPTLIRWWEALRAPEVVKWQQKYRVDWDATDVRNGGAQQTV